MNNNKYNAMNVINRLLYSIVVNTQMNTIIVYNRYRYSIIFTSNKSATTKY